MCVGAGNTLKEEKVQHSSKEVTKNSFKDSEIKN